MKEFDQHTSSLLLSLIERLREKESFTLQEIIDLLQGRGFGLAIILFCIPNCLPIPNVAGLSAITGIPIIIIGLEMLAGRSQLWLLPVLLGKKKIPSRKLAEILLRILPSIRKIETFLYPRLLVMSVPVLLRFYGAVFVFLAAIMSLPIPFMNMIPGWAMALMAIGLIKSDGVIICLGLATGILMVTLLFTMADKLQNFAQLFFTGF